jgi:hypothetical protein
MKIGLISLGAMALFASAAFATTASPKPKPAAIRVHSIMSFTAHGFSVEDADFVVAVDAAGKSQTTRSIFGYTNSSPDPGGGPVVTTFYRGVPTRRALANLQQQISNLDELPSACSLEIGSFITGSFEVTLYNTGPGSRQVIAVALDHNVPPAAQCPSSVETLLQLLTDFFTDTAHPIP